MKNHNIDAICNIETGCTNLEQALNVLLILIEGLDHDFGASDDKADVAALAFWSRREMYLESLYLIFREVTAQVERIRADLSSIPFTVEKAAETA